MMAIIATPWVPKLFYGIITDNFPIFGSTKKNYLILLTTLSVMTTLPCLYDFDNPNVFIFFITV